MKSIPVDVSRLTPLILVAVNPHMRDGEVVIKDGTPIHTVSVLRPPRDGQRVETFEVRVPAPGVAKDLSTLSPVVFTELDAFHWQMGDRSGISFSATTAGQTVGRRNDSN